MKHATVRVPYPYGGGDLDIDAALAPLLPLLWRRGIDTCQCCQEYHPGLACIEFPGTDDACEFLYVAQRNYRMELETWDEGEDGELAVVVRLLVLFPAAEIARLVEAFDVPDDEPRRPARGKGGDS